MQQTYRHPTSGDVRVVPVELADRYADRGWELLDQAAPAPATEPPPDPRPAKSAKIEEWRAYAINHAGVPSHEAGSLTKDELIERVG
jgi:hypothetical protein